MFCWAPSQVFLILFLLAFAGHGALGQGVQAEEYQVKAAFLYNFAKFVEWPTQAFATASAPLVIGVLGENPFHDTLRQVVEGKTIDGHPLRVKELRSLKEVGACHILFISTSERRQLPDILKLLKGAAVLTVGEMDGFTEAGGMINFVLVEGTKIRFQINKSAATSGGLKVSSKLLGLALRPDS